MSWQATQTEYGGLKLLKVKLSIACTQATELKKYPKVMLKKALSYFTFVIFLQLCSIFHMNEQ